MAKYDIDSLKKIYNDFFDPQYSIKINGKTLNEDYTDNKITIEITATYEASSCNFEIINAFKNMEENQIVIFDDIQSNVKLGSSVEVMLGYKDTVDKKVFEGYIDTLYVDYSKKGGIIYSVECLDAKGIMMNSCKSEVKKSINKYSEAVEKTFKNYSKLIKKQSIDNTEKITTPIEQHNESDYDFVVKLAKRLNYTFYIINGEVFFQKMGKDKNLFFEFDINEYVQSFSMFSSLKNQVSQVFVRNNNEKDPQKPFEADVSDYENIIDGSNTKLNNISIINNKVTKTIIEPYIDSEASARQRAKTELDSISYNIETGKISIVGIPDIIPGKIVSVNGFGKQYNKKYYITKVIHKIDDGQYITECELRGNKL